MTILILAFLGFFVTEGFIFAQESSETVTIVLRIPFFWINVSAPVGGVFLFILYFLRLLDYMERQVGPAIDNPAVASEARS